MGGGVGLTVDCVLLVCRNPEMLPYFPLLPNHIHRVLGDTREILHLAGFTSTGPKHPTSVTANRSILP
jgi:hypothetical protein